VDGYDAARPLIIDPALVYSVLLDGTDHGAAIAVDSAGHAYLTGTSGSTDFPTTSGTFQDTFGGGSSWTPRATPT
jgi:hypothetical protein